MSRNYNTREASKYLRKIGVSATAGTMEVWRCRGRGPAFIRIMGRVYYPEENLVSFATGQPVKTIDSISMERVPA